MRFIGFTIKNFKGIGEVTLDLEPAGANVFTLIGLNESGKTTILEAINHQSVMIDELVSLYGEAGNRRSSEELSKLVPKSEQSDFSDKIQIGAKLAFARGERESIIEKVEKECKCTLSPESIPVNPILTREYEFKDSDYKSTRSFYNFTAQYRSARAQTFKRTTDDSEVWKSITHHLRNRIPEIAYFPTFLFNQPERIYLTPHTGESQSNALYRTIIENIARSLAKPLDVQRHLVERLISEETWVDGVFSLIGLTRSKQQQITAAKNEISNHLTRAVFQSWSKTFGGDIGGREILLNVAVESEDGKEPLAYATFEIKDEGGQYEIRERSLGFRWFFSFILFTLFGANKTPGKSTLFLLDEPASNLHSRAQMQLLESFSRITGAGNQIIYSTHSHYMINPDWLDQAFIVSNAAIDYDKAYQNDNVESKTDITAKRYRAFVGENPDKVTYFQPVLDKLDVAPSRLDLVKKSVLVEGKGDYRILEYISRFGVGSKRDFAIVPTRGAAGMDELVGLFLGWSVPFVICLDDDREGQAARKRYIEEWGLPADTVLTLADVDSELSGKRIEDILEPDDVQIVRQHFGVPKVSKSQIGLFFSEKLARSESTELSKKAIERVKAFQAAVEKAFAG
jgi:predicted ATP-dependent endonuclease of OLD family